MDYYSESLKLHAKTKGKWAMKSKVAVTGRQELALAYTPGVAQPSLKSKTTERTYINIPLRAIL